ncbi:MAG TPA: hypothetical protein DCZ48_14430 [Methylococcaceae bacterium]|jgi:hypothetical protein|uniref:hypothetical protein n=1 Tax=Tepidicella baoligensis TaxID=2707016 RepID=UPI000E9D5B18|nr:hypothetical protein [Tepidicella baoligensis]HBA67345.1 hypothetical protein [Methylococcaceae bacterium]
MDIPPEPKEFQKLCGRIGLAIMLGQKVQYALAGYLATYSRVHAGDSVEAANAQLNLHISKPMGVVISAIERTAPLPKDLWEKVKFFQAERNWLVHDFDQEATPHLVRNEQIPEYIARMESIAGLASYLMQALNDLGEALVSAGT